MFYCISVSTRALIGQFSGPYPTVWPTIILRCFFAKIFLDLSPSVVISAISYEIEH